MTELAPCPFCGNTMYLLVAHINLSGTTPGWGVECGCHSFGPVENTEAEAITAWNTRPSIATLDQDNARLREALRGAIEWTPGLPPKEDGKVVYGHTWSPYRWKAYSPKSEQFRHGLKGRWQKMNEYAGWENAPAPNEWATEEAIAARTALQEGEGQP